MCSIFECYDQRRGTGRWYARVSSHLAGAVVCAAAFAAPALAAPPPADTEIGNQAVASFESGGQQFSVSSNVVITTIKTIAGVQIESDLTKSAVPGGKVFFSHTITNTGNDADAFALTPPSPSSELTLVGIYPDANCDGEADTLTDISLTPTLQPGGQFCVVVELNVANTVSPATADVSFDITAETTNTQADNYVAGPPVAPNDLVTDTVQFTDTEVFEFTKSMTLETDADGSGSITPGDTLLVTLTYNNTGLANATGVTISDPLPAGLEYQTGTAFWSDSATALNDAATGVDATNGQNDTITYSADAGTGQVTAEISEVPRGREGTLEFNVLVASDATGTIENVATIESDTITTPVESNVFPITIEDSDAISVTLGDSSTTNGQDDGNDPDGNLGGAISSSTDDDGDNANDEVYEDEPVAESATVHFEVVIENHSNTGQAFNLDADMSAVANPFPSATAFSFYTDTGGVIFDSNSDGMPDILVAAGGTRKIDVRADLPQGDTRALADPAWEAEIIATALNDTSVSNRTLLKLESLVQGAAVDLLNDDGGTQLADGPAVDDGGNPWVTRDDIDPGETAEFTLIIENEGLADDSFNLSYSDADPFVDGSMPAGWQVVFKDSTGSIITNTGVVVAGDSLTVTAEVTSPATAVPGPTDIYFRATSATTAGVSDTKLDRVTTTEVIDVAIRSSRTGQAAPGGVVVMSHTLQNLSNVNITAGAIGYVAPGFQQFTGSLYLDTNEDGEYDAADTLIDDIADIVAEIGDFEPGDTVMLFSRVQVPSTTIMGLSETVDIEVSDQLTSSASGAVTDRNTGNNSVTDKVEVVSGDVEVVKMQALDEDCDGTPEIAATESALEAEPGQCIMYFVTATNTGSENAENMRIDDEVPQHTTIQQAPVATGGSTAAVPAGFDGSAGPLRSTHGTLQPGGVATLEFSVKINE